jgi:acylphosphatase
MHSHPPVCEVTATVHGLVQGVFFRHHTRLRASELGLTGTVENLPDGTVRVVAQGARPEIETLLAWLATGPPLARVDRVETVWSSASERLSAFGILR